MDIIGVSAIYNHWVPELLSMAHELVINFGFAKIAALTKGVSENESDFRPAKDEWNIKEVLAHLIHGERYLQQAIHERIYDQECVSDGYAENAPCRIEATAAAYPTLAEILEEYHHSMVETVEIISRIPSAFEAHKGSYWRQAYEILQFAEHIDEHIPQMEANLAATRK